MAYRINRTWNFCPRLDVLQRGTDRKMGAALEHLLLRRVEFHVSNLLSDVLSTSELIFLNRSGIMGVLLSAALGGSNYLRRSLLVEWEDMNTLVLPYFGSISLLLFDWAV